MSDDIAAWRDGNLVPMDKLAVHQRGLRHPAVSVFLMADDGSNRTLIQRRALQKYHTPGLWANACCTHPHWGEGALACAQRRIGQELGVHVDPAQLRHVQGIEYRADVGGGLTEHEVVDIFVAQCPASTPMALNPAEVMGCQWISLTALQAEIIHTPERFTPWLRIYFQQGLARLLGPADG